MQYFYNLNKKAKAAFNIDTMVCNGWFGVYSTFNEYWNGNKKVKLELTSQEIDYIIENSISSECASYEDQELELLGE